VYTIRKEIKIEIAHHLPLTPKDHKCHRLHGHGYKIICTFKQSDKDFDGNWITDFSLPQVKRYDHRCLNDFMENPTAENFAKKIFDELPDTCVKVEAWETENSCAVYENL